ncbi:MAG: hypothetical protein GWO02_10825, partial [Gammaproteobacteria bacterium]|nr:hypothetical protein [Gammaproteobacteria bacterium]
MPWRSTPGVLGACALAAAALLLGGPARGGEFTPDDLTQVERTWLSNGLMVLMKPLPRARRIAVRLVV